MPPSANATAELLAALGFLRALREDAAIRARVERLDPADGLGPVVAIAADAGFLLTAASLRRAHGYDWALRQARYAAPSAVHPATADSAASAVAVVNRASLST